MDRGIIFTTDSLIASIAVLLILLSASGESESLLLGSAKNSSTIQLQLFASSLSEAIVKNSDPENPAHGAAYFDNGRKRAQANIIDGALLERIGKENFGKYTLAGIYERDGQEMRELFMETSNGRCASAERFVIIKGALGERRAVLGVVACEG
ncbi:MAG TPA: hypothetical protein HA254_07525 [Candidatus Diapherotrites archaeon]|uniref:Uncharacterized protein n=1 Tax=Candidatus Iainarchaeum sp. TaxID=3101447 RepID=A0A7J4J328_9ARCH|nr:hypothetical protein [Candidatus Diapherotrites archaeon]